MFRRGVDAFDDRDSASSHTNISLDLEVDALIKVIRRELTRYMTAHTDAIPRCLHLMTVSKSLERIADRAPNVAEEVAHLCEAQDIRHAGKAQSAPPVDKS